MTTVADALYQYGGMPVTGGIPPFVSRTSKAFFVDPVNGADGNDGGAPNRAFQTLYQLHNKMTSGNNDVGFLIGTGAIAGSAVLTTALAQTIDSTATGGSLLWSKSACHLIGVASPSNNSRAKIATVYDRDSTTYTAATFVDTNFVYVTGNGCYFKNISAQSMFSTGAATFICWNDAGSRNVYENCQFFGMMDAASAGGTGSRSLKVGASGSGENTFIRCQIGQDTVARTVANASLELAGGTPRNTFYKCLFPILGTTTSLGIIGSGAACIDRWNHFEDCSFISDIQSTGSTLDALTTLPASAGGLLHFKDCSLVGITEFGTDATTRNQIYVMGASGTAATTGIAIIPT